MTGKVYLVGAGCAPGLITVRGQALLRSSEAVVYDELLDSSLLREVPESAVRLYVGKRSGRPGVSQEEIVRLLLDLAGQGKQVVRLHGGDPAVFGRGGEEAAALRAAGIPFEWVPGVTSAVGIPALAGIPVTYRGISRSVHVVTAHTAGTGDGLPERLDLLARLPGTLVFLMVLARLEILCRRLREEGMDPATPAAVCGGAGPGAPLAVRGTLADIAARTREERVTSPALLVVGPVASLALTGPAAGPLREVSVGLTGSDRLTVPLREKLAALGARPFVACRTLVQSLPVKELKTLLAGPPGWLVFTSGNGVERFFALMREQRTDFRCLARYRLAVVGPATGQALSRFGFCADLCPGTYTTRSLGESLLAAAEPGERMILLRSSEGGDDLPRILRSSHPVREVPLYHMVPDPAAARAAERLLPGADYLLFGSAGGVALFFDTYGSLPANAVPVCLGPVTAAALAEKWQGRILTAPESTADSLVQTVLEDRKQRKPLPPSW